MSIYVILGAIVVLLALSVYGFLMVKKKKMAKNKKDALDIYPLW